MQIEAQTPVGDGLIAIPEPRVFATARGPVHASDSGVGPALLAIHGGMGGYDQSFILAQALLGRDARYRVIAASRAGYFGTPSGAAPDAAWQADLHAALLDALGVDRVVVAAVSAGGPSALHFALRHPRRCRGLILVSAASGPFDVPPRVARRLRMMRILARVPGLLSLLLRRAGRDPDNAARRSIPDDRLRQQVLSDPDSGPLLRSFLSTLGTRLDQRLAGTVIDTASFATLPPIPFAEIGVPCLVLHGDSDRVVPVGLARIAAAQLQHATLRELPGGDHTALFTHLGDIRETTRSFISALPA